MLGRDGARYPITFGAGACAHPPSNPIEGGVADVVAPFEALTRALARFASHQLQSSQYLLDRLLKGQRGQTREGYGRVLGVE